MTDQYFSIPDSFNELFNQSREEDINLFSIAVKNVMTGVTVADARDPELPLIYVNPGFENITGYSAEEVLGKSCRFLQGEEKEQEQLDVMRAALKKGDACTVRLRNFQKDGTLFHNELHISPVRNKSGELTHFVGIQLDVTERVRAKESLERSERQTRLALEREAELNEIKSRFISMVSHEFRTPMTGMHSSAVLLRRFGEKLGKEKTERHLLNIETSLKRMNRLLDDVLFFSRSESDKIQVKREPIIMGSYIENLLENLKPVYPDRIVELKNLLHINTQYEMDSHLLDHIFHNLLGNAFKYSPVDTVTELKLEEDDRHVSITVTDQGIGIPEEDQAHLFEPFHRATNVGTSKGTGLGLNIALHATQLLDGTLSFVSKQGEGSSFIVRLPVQ